MNNKFGVKILESNDDDDKLVLDVDTNTRMRYLYLGHPTDSKIVRNINVGNCRLFIGLNNQNRINSLELVYAVKYWKYLDILIRPKFTIKGLIEFVNVQSRLNEFDDMSIDVYTDKEQSAVKIEIDVLDRSNSIWVAISDNCLAEILDNYLIGFWIDLS